MHIYPSSLSLLPKVTAVKSLSENRGKLPMGEILTFRRGTMMEHIVPSICG